MAAHRLKLVGSLRVTGYSEPFGVACAQPAFRDGWRVDRWCVPVVRRVVVRCHCVVSLRCFGLVFLLVGVLCLPGETHSFIDDFARRPRCLRLPVTPRADFVVYRLELLVGAGVRVRCVVGVGGVESQNESVVVGDSAMNAGGNVCLIGVQFRVYPRVVVWYLDISAVASGSEGDGPGDSAFHSERVDFAGHVGRAE